MCIKLHLSYASYIATPSENPCWPRLRAELDDTGILIAFSPQGFQKYVEDLIPIQCFHLIKLWEKMCHFFILRRKGH
uniref:Uncharacterized protein n=1 Tax=Sphaerodactylus townsendi TaxID=933632 RepID=A0ACB8G351_9SAUR